MLVNSGGRLITRGQIEGRAVEGGVDHGGGDVDQVVDRGGPVLGLQGLDRAVDAVVQGHEWPDYRAEESEQDAARRGLQGVE